MPLFQWGTKQGVQTLGKSGAFDLGISEALGSLGTSLFGAPNPAVVNNGSLFYSPASNAKAADNPTVLSAQATNNTPTTANSTYGPTYSGPKTGATGGGNSAGPAGNQTLQDNIGNQLQSGLGQVDNDYNSYLSSLNEQQNSVQRGAENANQQIDAGAQGARTALQQQGVQANSNFDTQAQQANKQSSSSIQQARDLYRQLQQQNVAQLSGLGINSSSVAEALAENLGTETARRIAGVTGSRDEVLQNIEKERGNINNYVKQRLTDLETQVASQKATIQSQLLDQIGQINNARNVGANDRANKRQSLISQAQDAIAQLTANAQNFQQSLQMWQAQNTQKVNSAAVTFDDLNKAITAAGSSNGYNLMDGFSAPQQVPDANGAYRINSTPQKNPYEFDYTQYGL